MEPRHSPKSESPSQSHEQLEAAWKKVAGRACLVARTPINITGKGFFLTASKATSISRARPGAGGLRQLHRCDFNPRKSYPWTPQRGVCSGCGQDAPRKKASPARPTPRVRTQSWRPSSPCQRAKPTKRPTGMPTRTPTQHHAAWPGRGCL